MYNESNTSWKKKTKKQLTHYLKQFESALEKTKNLGFRPGPTQTRLYSHRIKLEA